MTTRERAAPSVTGTQSGKRNHRPGRKPHSGLYHRVERVTRGKAQ